MDKKVGNILKYLLSALVAAALLYLSFRQVKWDDFILQLSSCRWGWIAVSMLAGVMAFWLRAIRWRQLVLPLDETVTRLKMFNAVNIGYLANFAFPRAGEFVRCGVVSSSSSKATYEKVLGTVALERSWDLVSMLFLLVTLLVARWKKFGDFFLNQIWEPASERLDFSLWWIVGLGIALVFAAGILIWKLRERNKICSKIYKILCGLADGFTSFARMSSLNKFRFLADTVLIWGMYWVMAVATMRAVPQLETLTLVDALFLSLAGSLGWVVPVPGGFGSFHFIVSLALSSIYALPFSQGMVFATRSHESQSVTMILCGAISLAIEFFRKK